MQERASCCIFRSLVRETGGMECALETGWEGWRPLYMCICLAFYGFFPCTNRLIRMSSDSFE
jgi:hypothetical protein